MKEDQYIAICTPTGKCEIHAVDELGAPFMLCGLHDTHNEYQVIEVSNSVAKINCINCQNIILHCQQYNRVDFTDES